MGPEHRERVGFEESRKAAHLGRDRPGEAAEARRLRHRLGEQSVADAVPELAHLQQTVFGAVARDQRRVDRADRGSDHPVRRETRLVERLVHARLIGAERTAALEDQHGLSERGVVRTSRIGARRSGRARRS
jgi:hypothetical protein